MHATPNSSAVLVSSQDLLDLSHAHRGPPGTLEIMKDRDPDLAQLTDQEKTWRTFACIKFSHTCEPRAVDECPVAQHSEQKERHLYTERTRGVQFIVIQQRHSSPGLAQEQVQGHCWTFKPTKGTTVCTCSQPCQHQVQRKEPVRLSPAD